MDTSTIKIVMTPMEYFHGKIGESQSRLHIALPPRTEFYLVNLLCEFIDPARLNATVGGMDIIHQPLVLLFKQAMECPPNSQIKAFKRLGDISLYVAGFFQEYFNRRTYDIDYFMGMGRSAYLAVSGIMRDRHNDSDFCEMYESLAAEFHHMVDLVATIADSQEGRNINLPSLLLRHERVPSERLRQLIAIEDEIPFDPLKNAC